jgi:hypothetical protein
MLGDGPLSPVSRLVVRRPRNTESLRQTGTKPHQSWKKERFVAVARRRRWVAPVAAHSRILSFTYSDHQRSRGLFVRRNKRKSAAPQPSSSRPPRSLRTLFLATKASDSAPREIFVGGLFGRVYRSNIDRVCLDQSDQQSPVDLCETCCPCPPVFDPVVRLRPSTNKIPTIILPASASASSS